MSAWADEGILQGSTINFLLALDGRYIMGLLSRLFGGSRQNKAVANLPGPGTYAIDVVGESNYQVALEAICGGRTDDGHDITVMATLVHEDDNPHDNKAIRVDIDGETVGYLSRKDARQYRKKIAEAGCPGIVATCSAMIVGGWDHGGGDIGHFGVKLDLPTSD